MTHGFTQYGPGDPETWGPVMSSRDPRNDADGDWMECLLDGNTVQVEFIVSAGEVEVVSVQIAGMDFDPYSFDRGTREDLAAQIWKVIA